MRRAFMLLAVMCVVSFTCSHADVLTTFSFFNATAPPAVSVAGTITIDTTTGQVTDLNLSIGSFTITGPPSGYYLEPDPEPFTSFSWYERIQTGPYSDTRSLYLLFPTRLINYAGGPLCGLAPNCMDPFDPSRSLSPSVFTDEMGVQGQRPPPITYIFFQTVSLVPSDTVVTPEPASWLLTGTALLGIGGLLRQRQRRYLFRCR